MKLLLSSAVYVCDKGGCGGSFYANDEEVVLKIVPSEVLAMAGVRVFHNTALSQELIDTMFNLVTNSASFGSVAGAITMARTSRYLRLACLWRKPHSALQLHARDERKSACISTWSGSRRKIQGLPSLSCPLSWV